MLFRLAHLLAVGAMCAALSVTAVAQSKPTADALARSLQQRYQSIKDFSADFVHSYRGGVLKTQSEERGKVSVKKPSRMRWTYTCLLYTSDAADERSSVDLGGR